VLEDLEWLGLEPDAGTPVCRQSEATDAYRSALTELGAGDGVFACDCSRKDLAESAGDVFNQETRYGGRCRTRCLADGPGRGLRLRLDPGVESFDDARLGPQRQDPSAQCGDLLLRDRLGQWTYQLAVVVDDLRQEVDLVIRGEDLLPSTGRQIRLGRLLGRPAPPVFLHHPLIRKPTGDKLSKSSGDTAIRELRSAGHGPDELLGRAAQLTGLQAGPWPIEASELAKLFAGG
jgi:glutamyl-tRNA synthetase/glutamyl-Q tRNA(Asp) synthetase